MVVNEKGLLRAMKEAYKGAGYKVATTIEGGIEEIHICYPGWAVVIEKKTYQEKFSV